MQDVMKAGHCASGARVWFERHGLDFRDFLKGGITVARLRELNDGFAEQVIRRKEAREDGQR